MVRYFSVLIISIFFVSAIQGQEEIKWMTIQEAMIKSQKEPRKILVDVYTDWCGWCKVMDKSTYSDSAVINYINKNYYAVKFNAEQKEDIVLGDKTYKFVAAGNRGYHELAAVLLNKQLGYPSTVFIDETATVVYMRQGYIKPILFDTLINFIGGDHYKNVGFDVFSQKFESKAKDPA